MKLILPQRVSGRAFDKALKSFAEIVGDEWVLATDQDRHSYLDSFAPGDAETHAPSAAVAPKNVEEVREIVRVANRYKVPLWPISRGKNYGYGGSAPRMQGAAMLDLTRMNRILEVNEEAGYALLEPGVGFNQFFEYLQANKIKLWMSAPAQTLGSVVGNALERGVGYTPYGDHASKVCGMEVVLPDGDLVRTGMGAMSNSSCWQLFRHGYGPEWDGVFMQSNFGVVTKMGLWLMPEPEATMNFQMHMPNEEDLETVVDAIRPLRIHGVIQNNPSVGNAVRSVAIRSTRDEWYQGDGPMPESVIREIIEKNKIGWWNFSIRLYGYEEAVKANLAVVKDAFSKITDQEFKVETWRRGDPIQRSGAAIPMATTMQIVNWRGGRGGHLTFSPISPPVGAKALKQYRLAKKTYEEFGFDYSGGFTAGERYFNHISMILFDQDDVEMTDRARALFAKLVSDAAAEGFGEYRTHLSFMDQVAKTYDFNGNALMRLNERMKDAVDPNGILAPGKQGIWPKALREKRS